jgi:hypothetical protein
VKIIIGFKFPIIISAAIHECGVDWHTVNDVFDNLSQLWEVRPGVVLLLGIGFVVFVFLVIDTWRHRKRQGKHL